MDPTLLTDPNFWEDTAIDLNTDPDLAGQVLFETSGSSSSPKTVVISKQALLISAAAVNQILGVTPESVWGLALPLNHVGGFGVAARAYEAGCPLKTFPRRWDAVSFQQWLAKSGVTHTSLVPTQVHDLVTANLSAPHGLMAIVVGGGILNTATGQAARDLGWPVLASYGMTEASSQIATQGLELLDFPYNPAPIPLLPIWDAKSCDQHLLSIAGPALFSGFLVKGRYTPRESPWYLTSDRVLLEGRNLTPLGRADNLVKILGELVDPEAIERELVSFSDGLVNPASVAVIAIPDSRCGSRLIPIFENSVATDLIASVLKKYAISAPGFRRLQTAIRIENMPRTALGKLRRNELERSYQELRLS